MITVLTGMIAGVAPALYETRRLHTNPLRTLATSDRVRQRWRHTLVVAEIVVTVALFVETAALIDGYQRTRNGEMGFATRPLMTALVENPAGIAIGSTLDVIRRVPGIAGVSVATAAPFSYGAARERVAADAGGSNAVVVERATVTGDFFSTLGVPMRAGRSFSSQDSPAARIAVVSESLAKRMFPGASAVGQRIWIAGAPHDVIGVVADYAHNPESRSPARIRGSSCRSRPDAKNLRRLAFIVRAESDPGPLVQPVRRQVPEAAPGTIVTSAYTFDQIRTIGSQEVLVGTAPLVPLIAIGTLLTAAGIYGVLAFAITRRSRELAVRMAVGATSGDVVRLVTGPHAPARRHRRDAGHRLDLRALARGARVRRGRQRVRPARPRLRVAGRGGHGHRRDCHVGAVAPRAEDQSGGAAAIHLTARCAPRDARCAIRISRSRR